MNEYKGKSLSWQVADGVIELALDRAPANEIGLAMLDDLERFTAALPALESQAQRADSLQQAECRLLGRRGPARTVHAGAEDGDGRPL